MVTEAAWKREAFRVLEARMRVGIYRGMIVANRRPGARIITSVIV